MMLPDSVTRRESELVNGGTLRLTGSGRDAWRDRQRNFPR